MNYFRGLSQAAPVCLGDSANEDREKSDVESQRLSQVTEISCCFVSVCHQYSFFNPVLNLQSK